MITKIFSELVLGQKYPGNHDYSTLRWRYAKHVGAYGWTIAIRLGRRTIVLEKSAGGSSTLRCGTIQNTCRPYWDRTDWRWPFQW